MAELVKWELCEVRTIVIHPMGNIIERPLHVTRIEHQSLRDAMGDMTTSCRDHLGEDEGDGEGGVMERVG